MLRRMIAPAGFAAVLGLFASAALADGEKRTVQESRVESFDRKVEPPRRAAVHAPASHRRMALSTQHHAHSRHAHHAAQGWGGHRGLYPRRHRFIAGVSARGWPGFVNVATVTYRTHVYDTSAYPGVFYGYPPLARLYDLTPGPIYNKPCFC